MKRTFFWAFCSLSAIFLPGKAIASENDPAANGFEQISPKEIPGNIIRMIDDHWMLITAGDSIQKGAFNTMTASWGGLGVLWGKPVSFIFVRNERYTYQLLEKSNYYTLSFYAPKYRPVLKDIFGTLSGRDKDKVKLSGFTPLDTGFGAGYAEASLILCCRKIYGGKIAEENAAESERKEWYFNGSKDYHKMYIGEILSVWIKRSDSNVFTD